MDAEGHIASLTRDRPPESPTGPHVAKLNKQFGARRDRAVEPDNIQSCRLLPEDGDQKNACRRILSSQDPPSLGRTSYLVLNFFGIELAPVLSSFHCNAQARGIDCSYVSELVIAEPDPGGLVRQLNLKWRWPPDACAKGHTEDYFDEPEAPQHLTFDQWPIPPALTDRANCLNRLLAKFCMYDQVCDLAARPVSSLCAITAPRAVLDGSAVGVDDQFNVLRHTSSSYSFKYVQLSSDILRMLLLIKRLTLFFTLVPNRNCTPVGFENFALEETAETLNHAGAMESRKQKLPFNPQMEAQKKDWHSMIQSYDLLLDYKHNIKENEAQTVHFETINNAVQGLTICHNYLRHIFGVPGESLRDALGVHKDPSERLEESDGAYKSSIWNLISVLETPMNMPEPLHHVQIAGNDCILQTIEYIRKYNLAPAGMAEEIQISFKSQRALEWLTKSSIDIFRQGTKFHNDYHCRPFEEVHLKNHFQLTNFNNLYQDLSKSQQDWCLFQYLAARMNPKAQKAIMEDETSPKGFFKPMLELIQFSRKLKKFLLNELESDNNLLDPRIEFLRDSKVDLVKLIEFITEPALERGMSLFDLKIIVGNMFATVDFILSRFLNGYRDENGSGLQMTKAMEFRKKMKLLRLATNIYIWRNMVFDYDHYISKYEDEGHKIPKSVQEATRNFYWRNLNKYVASYKSMRDNQSKQDYDWKQKIEGNIYYKHITDTYDRECEKLEDLHRNFENSKE
ncbi:uncharacterized protein PGTG_11269 [Puccinia graminis f. sp. tritici CRL 75-36-700-3]|uniref:Uncharacterized protein n=1 Tax=Puccinia graminis f. sp. tritici (strain CRL 75-36-700-3 / race SCCL) TaxID=418459 RepID=E3KLC5_PUCGT|nr:uncharacterized protein PGTG_11269 [Puccinia graminis f. sp. tritici CRL 75-36-700-3]EFP85100.2 hypothetical protein PGTG_11269 [Puccinia graminis f. sp. tritici CRL 75-36-700-3]